MSGDSPVWVGLLDLDEDGAVVGVSGDPRPDHHQFPAREPDISVVGCTRYRPEHVRGCLTAFRNSKWRDRLEMKK